MPAPSATSPVTSPATDTGTVGCALPDSETLDSYYRAHRETWDMGTLNRDRPDVVAYLNSRYRVDFGMFSDVVVVPRDGSPITFTGSTDVRKAVSTIFDREIAAAREANR